jgi:hypothetical protein
MTTFELQGCLFTPSLFLVSEMEGSIDVLTRSSSSQQEISTSGCSSLTKLEDMRSTTYSAEHNNKTGPVNHHSLASLHLWGAYFYSSIPWLTGQAATQPCRASHRGDICDKSMEQSSLIMAGQ